MKNKLLISVENIPEPPWLAAAEDFLEQILKNRKHNDWELSVLFCSDAFIQKLNNDFRHINSATDVLSFVQGAQYKDDQGKTWYAAGDIALSLEFLQRNVSDFGVSANEELKRLLIHGILHLEGMDHGDTHVGELGSAMLDYQEQLVKEFQPYIIIEER